MKLCLLVCFGLSANATPLLFGMFGKKTDAKENQHASQTINLDSFFDDISFDDLGVVPNVETDLALNRGFEHIPGTKTTFKDENGNVVTQVKKEYFNNDKGLNNHFIEIEEIKKLPNGGHAKTFIKGFSSSSLNDSPFSMFDEQPPSAEEIPQDKSPKFQRLLLIQNPAEKTTESDHA